MKAINTLKKIAIGMVIFSFALAYPFVCMATEVESIDIVEYGLYKTTFDQWQQAPNTARGQIQLVADRELVKKTLRVPGSDGTEFGIRYVVKGAQEGGQVDLLVRVLHAESNSSDEWTISRQIGAPSFEGWKFDSDGQIPSGRLTIQLYHHGTKLAEKSFTVYEAKR
jgi:hypothetical protein